MHAIHEAYDGLLSEARPSVRPSACRGVYCGLAVSDSFIIIINVE